MRFILLDRVIAFEDGCSAVGVKNVSVQEPFFDGHYERRALMPAPLIVEALAQLGGWCITASSRYRYLALMLRVQVLSVHADAVPGDQLRLEVRLEQMNEFGARISGRTLVQARPILDVGSITYGLYEIPEADRAMIENRYRSFMKD